MEHTTEKVDYDIQSSEHCPKRSSDTQEVIMGGNVIAVPLSAIQEDSKLTYESFVPSSIYYNTDELQSSSANRKPSMPLVKWTHNKKSETSTPNGDKQVSFRKNKFPRAEPVPLATLNHDCFIIPVQSLQRFLPTGIMFSTGNKEGKVSSNSNSLSVLEVSDPKICILVHLMTPLEPINPALESPLSQPLMKQKSVASELLNEVKQANSAISGMLLTNMEKNSDFPFIAYYVINTTKTDPMAFYSGIRGASLSKFEPKTLRYNAAHTLDLFSEVAAICRPPLVFIENELGSLKSSQTPTTGYIISIYKVFEGDDGEIFEKNWMYWTGARMLYRYLPRTAGLRRIALHKSIGPKKDKMYLLVCECADLLKDISSSVFLIPALRARLCGYTGLYKPVQSF